MIKMFQLAYSLSIYSCANELQRYIACEN